MVRVSYASMYLETWKEYNARYAQGYRRDVDAGKEENGEEEDKNGKEEEGNIGTERKKKRNRVSRNFLLTKFR